MRRLLTRHWLGVHVAVLFAVAAFLALGWWQAVRAGDGNMRSYGYAAEWPTFALIIIFLWVRAMRTELRAAGHPPEETVTTTVPALAHERELVIRDAIAQAEEEDEELAAYNRYLAKLHRRDLMRRR